MTLERGKNTYVTVEDANFYISNTRISIDNTRKSWEKLSIEDKSSLLVLACSHMQNIDLINSIKEDTNQELVFPRVGNYGYTGTSMTYGNVVYKDYMQCQIEEVLSILKDINEDEKELKSKTVGKISETYVVNATKVAVKAMHNISVSAYNTIKEWMGGGC